MVDGETLAVAAVLVLVTEIAKDLYQFFKRQVAKKANGHKKT